MNFIQSIKTCLRKYADFKGRASRSEFWWFQLFLIILEVGLTTLDHLILEFTWDNSITPLATGLDIVTVIPLAAVTARRLHDIGRSGWWQAPIFVSYLYYLDVFIPNFAQSTVIYGIDIATGIYSLGLLIMLIKDSQSITNQYGPNPKNPDMGEIFT